MEKQLTTQLSTNYSFTFKDGKPVSIVRNCGDRTVYYFNPDKDQLMVTDEILKEALRMMIGCNLAAFEILYVCLDKQEYRDIAIKVFKEHWNSLYNTVVADDVFQREPSFESVDEKHDFFAEKQ